MKKTLIFALLLMSQLSWAQAEQNRGYRVAVGDACPELDLAFLDGHKVDNESLQGKVVVLQFTASWCSVCRKEMPHLESEVWQRFKEDDFLLIGIDLKEKTDIVKAFKEKMGTTYPMAIDSSGALFEAFTLPGAGVTRNIVLDRNGKIIFLSRLYERKEFEAMIETIDTELKKEKE
jgi:peroxiredoxin